MKYVNRMLAAAMTCGMLLTALPASAEALTLTGSYSTETSGTCGDNLTWEYDAETGSLVISGTGDMWDYNWMNTSPWFQFWELYTVEIGEGVTGIGDYAFYGSYELTSVSLPDSLTHIGKQSFESCKVLEELVLPDGVTEIGDYAFTNAGLNSFTIPAGVTEIGEGIFYGCRLTEVTIPETVTSIGKRAFMWSELHSVVVPASVTEIEEDAFSICDEMVKAEIHAKIIGTQAFSLCPSLEEISLDGVEYLGEMAFVQCNALESVILPESVKRVDYGALAACESLSRVTVENPECEFIEETIPEEFDLRITICNSADESGDKMIPYYNGVICGYSGSTAQAYAEDCGYAFQVIGEVPEVSLGDVNGSGDIDPADASLILQEIARIGSNGTGSFSAELKKIADVNGNDEIDPADASIVLKYIAEVGAGNTDVQIKDLI